MTSIMPDYTVDYRPESSDWPPADDYPALDFSCESGTDEQAFADFADFAAAGADPQSAAALDFVNNPAAWSGDDVKAAAFGAVAGVIRRCNEAIDYQALNGSERYLLSAAVVDRMTAELQLAIDRREHQELLSDAAATAYETDQLRCEVANLEEQLTECLHYHEPDAAAAIWDRIAEIANAYAAGENIAQYLPNAFSLIGNNPTPNDYADPHAALSV